MKFANVFLLAVVVTITISSYTRAEEEIASNCSGVLYKAKREGVPVYEERATTSQVLRHLTLGEKVCYIGEEGEFAMIDQRFKQNLQVFSESEEPRVAFVRLVDLWNLRDRPVAGKRTSGGWFTRIRQFIKYIMSGGVPEDPLGPVRPIMGDEPSPAQ